MDVSLSPTGPADTIMPAMPSEAIASLKQAIAASDPKPAVAAVVGKWPTFCAAWAELGALAEDPVESYAYYRVGYHRGLDQLRGAGWRGSGFVRSSHPENAGFLAALRGLGSAAGLIGEEDEELRCAEFAKQLDP